MEKNNFNFEEDVRIDPEALDVEWLRQPQLMLRYASELAEARTQADFAKDALDVAEAEIDADIRANPAMYIGDDKKLTEATVSGLVTRDQKVRSRAEQLNRARESVGLLQAAVNAIETKKTALENLVRLLGQQYFAGPKEPRDLPEEAKLAERAQRIKNQEVRERCRKASAGKGGK